MNEPEHSQLPWSRDNQDRLLDANGEFIGRIFGSSTLVDEQNASLIVTAVNAHAELLEQAKDYHFSLIVSSLPIPPELEAAIAKAESLL